jgi:hypothetical protein
VDAFGWIGLGGLGVGLAGLGLGIEQRRMSLEQSQLLEGLRSFIVERAPERADEVARSLGPEPMPTPSMGADVRPADQPPYATRSLMRSSAFLSARNSF